MIDRTILAKAVERTDSIDTTVLATAHTATHETPLDDAITLSAHHAITHTLAKRGVPFECDAPPLLVGAVDVSLATFKAKEATLPDELVTALRNAFSGDTVRATVMTTMHSTGYNMMAVPRASDDLRDADAVWTALTTPPVVAGPPATDPDDDGDDDTDDDDDDDDDDFDDDDSSASILSRFFAVLGDLVGIDPAVSKGYTFHAENKIIARNKRRSIAKQEHDFKPSAYTTRKGVKRCMTCGGSEPPFGKCNQRPSYGMLLTKSEGAQTLVYKAEGGEERFTLAPMYIPNSEDAHGEWTDGDELQQSLWDYVRGGDRRIRLQHNKDVVAGEWVEIMSWPFPITVPVQQADGTTKNVDFPADTTFMGIIWEPWAWNLVLQGKITGLSIGGTAKRIEAPIPTEKSDPGVGSVHVDVPLGSRRPKRPTEG